MASVKDVTLLLIESKDFIGRQGFEGKQSMRFSIITPCFNAERYISETVKSILEQTALLSGRASLEYIVIDGQSTDRTLQIVEESTAGFQYGTVQIISEPDHGMYDALAKGLKLATGDICAYLNADDFYSPYAFDVILDVLENHSIRWLTGLEVMYNQNSQIVHAHLPYLYRSRLMACGLYDGLGLKYLQQESTFWQRDLHQYLDFDRLAQLKLAGDYYLWHQFSKHADLKIVEAYLGGFRIREGQLSEDLAAYLTEMRSIANRPSLTDRAVATFDRVMAFAPGRLSKPLRRSTMLIYDHPTQQWRWRE